VLIYRFEAPLIFANAEVFVDGVLAAVEQAEPPPKAVILDFAAVPDIDSTGDTELQELTRMLEQRGVQLVLARATGTTRELMRIDGVIAAVGQERVFPTVRAAVDSLTPASQP